jgi:hypothetical protein
VHIRTYYVWYTKLCGKKIFFIGYVKMTNKCLVRSRFGAPKIVLFTYITKMLFSCEHLCADIECVGVKLDFFSDFVDISKQVFGIMCAFVPMNQNTFPYLAPIS